MRKLSSFLLKATITIVFAVFIISVPVKETIAQECGKKMIGLTKALAEQRPCQKWTYDTLDNSSAPFGYTNYEQDMIKLFATCDNYYGPLKCYWSSAFGACKATMLERNVVWRNAAQAAGRPVPDAFTKFTFTKAGDYYRCSIGTANEQKNAGEFAIVTLIESAVLATTSLQYRHGIWTVPKLFR